MKRLLAVSLLLAPCTALALDPADIAVTDIVVDAQCRPVATLTNVGNTNLPQAAYDQMAGATYQFWHGEPRDAWASARFRSHDPQRQLVPPGGSVQVSISRQVVGTVLVSAEFKPEGSYTDTQPGNNLLSRSLTCAGQLPEIGITALTLDTQCRPVVTLRNLGNGALADVAYTTAYELYAQRRIDDAPAGQVYLKAVDPQKKLKAAGGEITFTDTLPSRPQGTLRYELKHLPSEGNVTSNDAMEIAIPSACAVVDKAGTIKPVQTLRLPPATSPDRRVPAKTLPAAPAGQQPIKP